MALGGIQRDVPGALVIEAARPTRAVDELRYLGYRIYRARDSAAALALAAGVPLDVVVTDAEGCVTPRGRTLVADMLRLNRSCRVLVEDDHDGWTTFFQGGRPLFTGESVTEGLQTPDAPVDATAAALAALEAELLGRPADALRPFLALGTASQVADAAAYLDDTALAAIDRLRNRSTFAVSVDVIAERFAPQEGHAYACWWETLQLVALRSLGLDVGAADAAIELQPRRRLFGSFHVARSFVLFTASRHWRRPHDLLADLSPSGRSTGAP